MKIINGYFDELEYWNSARFGKPIIKDAKIIIPTRNIEIYPGHPLNSTDKPIVLAEGQLIFSGVSKSERSIAEYLDAPQSGKRFKPSYTTSDRHCSKTDESTETFILQGV